MAHPHHPLTGQVVKVLHQMTHAGDGERCWVIQTPDSSWAQLPLPWGVPVDAPAVMESEPASSTSTDLWANVASLLALATMVRQLFSHFTEEVRTDAPSPTACTPTVTAAHASALGTTPDPTAPGIDPDSRDSDHPVSAVTSNSSSDTTRGAQ